MSISSGRGQSRGTQMGLSPSRWTGRHGQPSVAIESASVCCTRWAVRASLAVLKKVDSTVEESAYPISIAPQYLIDGEIKPVAPFDNMRAVSYEVTSGVEAEVRFEGEVFEMGGSTQLDRCLLQNLRHTVEPALSGGGRCRHENLSTNYLNPQNRGRIKSRDARRSDSTAYLGDRIYRLPTTPPHRVGRCLSRRTAQHRGIGTPQTTQPFTSASGYRFDTTRL